VRAAKGKRELARDQFVESEPLPSSAERIDLLLFVRPVQRA
jgi:hypothetical protein